MILSITFVFTCVLQDGLNNQTNQHFDKIEQDICNITITIVNIFHNMFFHITFAFTFALQDGLNNQTNEHFDKLDNDIVILNDVIELTKAELNSKIDRLQNTTDEKIDELDSKIGTTHNITLQIISELPPISNIVSYVVNVSIFHIFFMITH